MNLGSLRPLHLPSQLVLDLRSWGCKCMPHPVYAGWGWKSELPEPGSISTETGSHWSAQPGLELGTLLFHSPTCRICVHCCLFVCFLTMLDWKPHIKLSSAIELQSESHYPLFNSRNTFQILETASPVDTDTGQGCRGHWFHRKKPYGGLPTPVTAVPGDTPCAHTTLTHIK